MAVTRRSKTITQPPATPSPGESMPLAERRAHQIAIGAAHVDLDEIYTSDGLVAMISQRRANGEFTFAVFKQFHRDGDPAPKRTSFVPERLGESYLKIVQLGLDRMKAIRAEGSAPFAERSR